MNIFFLDEDPVVAAQYLVNRHVVKMVTESFQMLKLAHGDGTAYKNHPCSIWARTCTANYKWLLEYGKAIGIEYKFRYGRIHQSYTNILNLPNIPDYIPHSDTITKPALAMPDDCIMPNPVEAYRKYYNTHKRHLFYLKSGVHTWKPREIPKWISQC